MSIAAILRVVFGIFKKVHNLSTPHICTFVPYLGERGGLTKAPFHKKYLSANVQVGMEVSQKYVQMGIHF